jgi:hypothetical protein
MASRRTRGVWLLVTALTASPAGCADVQTLCPGGTLVTRRILSGGSEAEWCRREDGVRQGPEVRYYESGARMVEGEHLDGVRHGLWSYYPSSGPPWRQDRWEDGALVAKELRAPSPLPAGGDPLAPTESGIIKLASADPLLGRTARARELAVFAAWYGNGRARVRGQYDGEGLRTGTWRFWYEDGQLTREVDYDGGVRHRAFREWHPNGRAKTDGFYLDGERDGRWRRWDQTGHLVADSVYARVMLAP